MIFGSCNISYWSAFAEIMLPKFDPMAPKRGTLEFTAMVQQLQSDWNSESHMLDQRRLEGFSFHPLPVDFLGPLHSHGSKGYEPLPTYCLHDKEPVGVNFGFAAYVDPVFGSLVWSPGPCPFGNCILAAFDGMVSIDSARSALLVTVTASPTETVMTHAGGVLNVERSNCRVREDQNIECTGLIRHATITLDPFSVAGHTVTFARITNDGPSEGALVGESFLVPGFRGFGELRLADGRRTRLPLTHDSALLGVWDPFDDEFEAVVSFTMTSDDGATVDLQGTIRGTFRNTSPVAVATVPEIVECEAPEGTIVDLDGRQSVDFDGDNLSFRWKQGAIQDLLFAGETFSQAAQTTTEPLAMGEHVFHLEVIDKLSMTSRAPAHVEIVDTLSPMFELDDVPVCVWSPNHKFVQLELHEDINILAVDQCFGDVSTTARIVSVTSSEADNGLGDGNFAPDVFFDDNRVCIRAERSGRGVGRVYSVVIEVADPAENKSTQTLEILVPHDMSTAQCGAKLHGLPPCDPDLLSDKPSSPESNMNVTEEEEEESTFDEESLGCSSSTADPGVGVLILVLLCLGHRIRRRLLPTLLGLAMFATAMGCSSDGSSKDLLSDLEITFGAETYSVTAEGTVYLDSDSFVIRTRHDGLTVFVSGPGSALTIGSVELPSTELTVWAQESTSSLPLTATSGTLAIDAVPSSESSLTEVAFDQVTRTADEFAGKLEIRGVLRARVVGAD